jgi:hypothetical protein
MTTHQFGAYAIASCFHMCPSGSEGARAVYSSGLRGSNNQQKLQHWRCLEKVDICAEDNVRVCVLASAVLRGMDQRDKRGCLRPVAERIFDARAIIF